MNKLKNRIAIITGASSGIGLESCYLFAKEGCKIIAADINDKIGNEIVSEIIKKTGNLHVSYYHCDVSKESEVEQLILKSIDLYGGLDILFNNAGIMQTGDGNTEETDDKIWDLTMNINLKGVWYGCKHAIRVMKQMMEKEKQTIKNSYVPSRSIINTASFVATLGAATPQIAYTASKGAVLALTRELAVCHARDNIRINSISPGPLHTKLLMDFLDTKPKLERRLTHIPMGRFGEASEIANAALFLASDDSSFITGNDLHVDGGISSAYITSEGETLSLPPIHKSFYFNE